MNIFTIKEQKFTGPVINLVRDAIDKALPGGPVEIRVLRESKKRIQESKYHCMIADISKTVELDGKQFKPEIWKAWLVDDYETELLSTGENLTHPSQSVISLDGRRVVSIRASTEKFRKKEASDFIEYLYMKGVEYGARFTDKSMSIYENRNV